MRGRRTTFAGVVALTIFVSSGLEAIGQRDLRQAIHLMEARRFKQAEQLLRLGIATRSADALWPYELGVLFLARGQTDSARTYFAMATALDTTLAQAHHGLAIAQTRKRQYDEACAAFERAIELDPGHPAYHYNAGIVYEFRGILDRARLAFQASLQIDPMSSLSRRYLGSILLRKNKPREALEEYALASRLDPDQAECWYGLGKARARLGQDSLAIASLERARDLDEDFLEVYYQLSRLYRKAGRTSEAEAAMERLHDLKENRPEYIERGALKMIHPDIARDQYDLGRLYKSRGWPAAGEARLYRSARLGLELHARDKVLGTEPAKASRIERRAAQEAIAHRSHALALSHYRAAIELDADNAANYRGLGLALAQLERFDESMVALRTAIQIDPGFAPAYNDLALILFKEHGEYDEAIQFLQRAVDEGGREEILYQYNLAHVYLNIGQYERAAGEFEAVSVRDPNSALTYYSLGVTKSRHGLLAAAEKSLVRAIERNPEYAEAYFELGKVYDGQGRSQESAAMYEETIKRNPEHKYAHYGLAQADFKLGLADEARAALRRFEELPVHPKPQLIFFAPADAQ